MANPTGTIYLQANSGFVWTDGDIYQIPQADQQEGAAVGASFSGLGVDNQPHQILLNKIQLTHKNQVIDEANITLLQTLANLFTSSVGLNGYMKLGMQDAAKGQIAVIMQWGSISLIGLNGSALKNAVFSFNFPISFPNAIWMLLLYFQSNAVTGELALDQAPLIIEAITPLQKQGNRIASDLAFIPGARNDLDVAQSANDGLGLTGIGWLALGY